MASESAANGGSSIIDPLAPEHTYTVEGAKKDTTHRPTVEEVLDEEDIIHPPPSAHLASSAANDGTQGLSEKAAGKQPASDEPGEAAEPAPKPAPKLDVTSEEAFPSLGAPKKAATGWPGRPTGAPVNGINGRVNGTAASNLSSRSSTPASGMRTPASSARAGPGVNLPGRHSDSIQFTPAELIPPNQLKSSYPQIIQDINRRSRAKVEMKEGMGNTIKFVGTGPPDAVRDALREVASKLGSKQTVKLPIPASIRPHIVGRGGVTIQGISKRSGANVKLPQKRDDALDLDDDATIDVIIEGDATACKLARHEIESIVNERTSTVNMRLKEIPPEFFPFLAGPRGANLDSLHENRSAKAQIPHYYQWNEQAPVLPNPGQRASFAPHPQHSIAISGDRQHALEIQAELERQAAQLQSRLSMAQTPIERGRHQFIAGNKGQSLHDFFEETGCALVLPPPGDDSEELTIIGPADKLDEAMNKVMDLAASMAMASVDIARQHEKAAADAQAHARALTRYLQHRRAIEQLEQAHNASIVCPDGVSRTGPTAWEVFAKDGKDTMRARAEIMNLISGHPPSRVRHMDIDPFYHQHLRQNHAPALRRDSGVHVLFPSPNQIEHSPQLILVYEAPGSPSEYELPRQKPSATEAIQFERALLQAEQQLMELISAQEAIASREVQANPKFHDKVRRFVDREQAGLSPEQFPVQLLFGPPGAGVQQQQRRPGNDLSVRGPGSAVDELTAKILAFLEQEEQDEKERGYTTSFDFPSKFANFLIGKRGENINKLREQFDVDIQVGDGKVELKGPKAKCDACRQSIQKSAAKWEDETTHILKIKQLYHRDLIGAKGSQVNRLQDRYNVHINFPRSQQANEDGNDAATDAGSVRNIRHQNPDEVVIKGPRKGADEAREELLNLLQYTIDNSFVATVSVAQEQIPRLIGQGGREMDSLRMSAGCQIDVPSARDAALGPSGRAEIKLKGSKKQVEEAKKLLEEKIKVFDDTVTRTIEVDKKHHKALIGTGGANIRDIVARCGGPTDPRALARTVRFPRPDAPESTIRVEGPAATVEKIVNELTSFADQRATQVTSTITVDQSKHRLLIGRGGDTRRALEAQFHVSLDIPKQGTSDDQVKVTGQPSDVEKAKAHIADLVKEQEGVTVNVPKSLHHYVADNGQFFRRLRNDHRVTVDHGGMQPPPRPTGAGAEAGSRRVNNGAMPLITDERGPSADQYSWDVVETHPGLLADAAADTIPWILRAPNADAAAKAQALVERALEDGRKPNHTGYLILPDPRTYRFVVGPGGSGVNGVRKKTGCQVKVPKGSGGGGGGGAEAIEVAGLKDDVERAKELILELVKEGERRA